MTRRADSPSKVRDAGCEIESLATSHESLITDRGHWDL